MTADNLRFLITAVLGIHGPRPRWSRPALVTRKLGYVAAADQAGRLTPRSRVLPSLEGSGAIERATGFWIVSMIGFIAAALAFWRVLIPGEAWRILTVVSAVVSTIGIVLFAGTWPVFNTVAALSINAAVLVTQLWLRWPSRPPSADKATLAGREVPTGRDSCPAQWGRTALPTHPPQERR
jgi:hypothetical protein